MEFTMDAERQPTRYREIEASGPPRELGRQIGEAAREEVRSFCSIALERVRKTTPISREKAMSVARRSAEFAGRYSPDMMEELRGTAEAASVSIDELMLLQVRNQLQPEEEAGCTALSLPADPRLRRGPIVAQNWDNDPALDALTVVLTRRPTGKPALTTCTQAGLISYLGFNEAGMGACVNTLPAPSREVGVPHYFVLRGVYEASSLEEAAHAVQRAQRAIPANIMLSTPQGPADLEVTIDDIHVLRPDGHGWLTHTNHCVHAELASINDEFPELIQSHARKRRMDQLIAASEGEMTVNLVKSVLSDHEDHPTSICRHANRDPIYGFWETVFSIIIEPSERRMHVSRGAPCDHPYETYLMR
jgi:isopenicillin-N N-acyltransferase-like protein